MESAAHREFVTTSMPALMTTDELSDHLRIPARTLEAWRRSNSGPPYRRIGKHVRYREDHVVGWLEANEASHFGSSDSAAAR